MAEDDDARDEGVPPAPADGSARDAALAEFNALRAEIINRMTTTATLVGVGLTALGVIVTLVFKEGGDPRLLLTVPPLAFTVNCLWAVENRQIGLIGQYIAILLWPYLGRGDTLLPSWEEECAKRRRARKDIWRSIVTDYAMTLVFAGAAMGSLVILLTDRRETHVHPLLLGCEWILTLLALLIPFLMTIGNSVRAAGANPLARIIGAVRKALGGISRVLPRRFDR
jgi:hypothetical protein